MTLAPNQIEWADAHVGQETTLTGAVQSWKANKDGTVTFTTTFTATPPPSPEQEQERELERAAEAERVRKNATQMQVDEDKRIEDIARRVLAESRPR